MKDLIITAFGAVTSVITAIILCEWEKATGFMFYACSVVLVIPIGALVSGFVAASGYYCGARLLDYRPGRVLLRSMLLTSGGVFFLIHYLNYISLTVDGVPVRSVLSFGAYLVATITHLSINLDATTTNLGPNPALGDLGYLFSLLQIVGFAIGGFFVFSILVKQPYCATCSLYLKRMTAASRFNNSPDELKVLVETIAPQLNSGRLEEAEATHMAFGVGKADKNHYLRTDLTMWRCKRCSKHRVRFLVAKREKDNWKYIRDLGVVASPIVPGTPESGRA